MVQKLINHSTFTYATLTLSIFIEGSYYDETDDNRQNLPLTIAAFFLENVELTRQPLSLLFWNLFSDTITRLEFTDCAVLPRICVATKDKDGNTVNVDTVNT